MRKSVGLTLLFLSCSLSMQAAKKSDVVPSGYTIPVHVSAAHLVNINSGALVLHLDVTIADAKLELEGSGTAKGKYVLLTPGDYKAKSTSDIHYPSGMFYQEYDLLLQDNSVWKGLVTGISQ